jgi:preprotein translocase subunit SecE
MVMVKTTKKSTKRRKPKGKLVSERLADKERARVAEEPADDEDDLVDAAFEDDHDEDLEDDHDEDLEDDHDEDLEDEREEDGESDDDASGESTDDPDREADDEHAAGQLGHQRYVVAGFFGLWLVVGYICGRAVEGLWAEAVSRNWFLQNMPQLAMVEDEGTLISRASLSLVLGLLIGGGIVLRYYMKPETRTWADEVAEQLTKVKWPTRKEVGNNTVVVIVATTIITLYLTLLDRFWGFVTNLIYTGAA